MVEESSNEEVVLIDLFDSGCHIDLDKQKVITHIWGIIKRRYNTNVPFTFFMCYQDPACKDGSADVLSDFTEAQFNNLENGYTVVRDSNMAAILYSIKQEIDKLDITRILVILPQERRIHMDIYLENLFTPAYNFMIECYGKYCQVDSITFPCNAKQISNGISDEEYQVVARKNIQTYFQSLPALKGDLVILKSQLIPEETFLHGFTTRSGGITCIPTLSSLNLFCSPKRKDPTAVVEENFCRLGKTAGFDPQTYVPIKVDHAEIVKILGKTDPQRYDGIVTNQKGVTIAAPGADCIPILFCDPVKKACGAAHSGWKGTLLGVSMATVNAMVTEYQCDVKDIRVVLGPSVGPCCFTLTQEEARAFHDIDPLCVLQMESPKPYVDIRRATRLLLERGGILPQNIQDDTIADKSLNVTLCTSCHPEKFFSHVRDGEHFGTQICFIAIKD
ncbi:PREDICTED: laccase domain-containing protein 1 [Nanorana parkeri]|uniref:laccase domain-containing protein 1 n=1 Tax=Nanorana parkeri TaxID=125878 RepID=UPI0008548DCF|nr:PREDICTED: laccase domain-containing protein 1 [Nanorana parkeri]